eukprot:1960400-Alexandrium_andersonii.AAC.1
MCIRDRQGGGATCASKDRACLPRHAPRRPTWHAPSAELVVAVLRGVPAGGRWPAPGGAASETTLAGLSACGARWAHAEEARTR